MLYVFNQKNLTYKSISKKCLITTALSIIILITATTVSTIWYLGVSPKYAEELKTVIINNNNKFSEELMKSYILELNIKYPHIVYAQSILETNRFKSHMFLNNHNAFGMKLAKRRPTTNKGEENGHAYYTNWRESVVDYAFYQAAYLNNITSESEYYEYLKQNYAEDTLYINKLKAIIAESGD